MKTINYTEKKAEFVKLFQENRLNQRQIAKVLDVSEQSICKWSKKLKAKLELLKDTRTKLIKRLNNALDNPNTTSTDIHNYSTALSVLTKQINNVDDF